MNCVIHVIATVRGWLLGGSLGFGVTGFTVAVRPASGGNPVPTDRAEESDSSSPVVGVPSTRHATPPSPVARHPLTLARRPCRSPSERPPAPAHRFFEPITPTASSDRASPTAGSRRVWDGSPLPNGSSPSDGHFPLAPRAVGPSDWSASLVGRPARPPDGYRGSPREQSRESRVESPTAVEWKSPSLRCVENASGRRPNGA